MELEVGKFYKFIYGSHETWQIDAPDVDYVKYLGCTHESTLPHYTFLYYTAVRPIVGTIRGCRQTHVIHQLEVPFYGPNGTVAEVVPATEDDFLLQKETALMSFYEGVREAIEEMMFDSDNRA